MSITSSSDGAKLAAVSYFDYIYTSTNSGVSWTQQTASGSREWWSITSSSDGAKLAAVVNPGYIYTSSNSGVSWTQQTASGSRSWRSITSSSEGTKLAAVSYFDYIYTSSNSGVSWTQETASTWTSITSSSDGAKLAAAVNPGYIYTGVLGSSNLIYISNVTRSSFCEGASASIIFTVLGSYSPGNTFTAQLSNSVGSFANPKIIGSLNSTTEGTITAKIPDTISPGTGYRIRVISNNPVVIGTDNGSDMTISTKPSANIFGVLSVCPGSTQNYTVGVVSATNQWDVTGGVINGSSTSNSVNVTWTNENSGTIKLTQTNSSGCSNSTISKVTIGGKPNISGEVSVCSGSQQKYIANSSTNFYQWYVAGGTIIGSSTLSSVLVKWSNEPTGSVKLIQTLGAGCKDSTSIAIDVNSIPSVMIIGSKIVYEQTSESYSVTSVIIL